MKRNQKNKKFTNKKMSKARKSVILRPMPVPNKPVRKRGRPRKEERPEALGN